MSLLTTFVGSAGRRLVSLSSGNGALKLGRAATCIGAISVAQKRFIRYGKNPNQDNFESLSKIAVEELTKPKTDSDRDMEMNAFLARINNLLTTEQATEALTHYTFPGSSRNGDRLRCIGSSVANLYVTEMILNKHPNMISMHVDAVKNFLLSPEKVINYAQRLGLEHLIRGNQAPVGRFAFMMEDCFYSLLGSISLSNAPEAARDFITKFAEDALSSVELEELLKIEYPILMLRHLLAKEGRSAVRVVVLNEIAKRTHQPLFQVALYEGDRFLSQGAGRSLKDAKRAAARKALTTYFTAEFKLASGPTENMVYQEKVLEFTKSVNISGILKERF